MLSYYKARGFRKASLGYMGTLVNRPRSWVQGLRIWKLSITLRHGIILIQRGNDVVKVSGKTGKVYRIVGMDKSLYFKMFVCLQNISFYRKKIILKFSWINAENKWLRYVNHRNNTWEEQVLLYTDGGVSRKEANQGLEQVWNTYHLSRSITFQ